MNNRRVLQLVAGLTDYDSYGGVATLISTKRSSSSVLQAGETGLAKRASHSHLTNYAMLAASHRDSNDCDHGAQTY